MNMLEKYGFRGWLVGAVILAAAECAGVAAIEIAFTDPAQAQFFGRTSRVRNRPRPQGRRFLRWHVRKLQPAGHSNDPLRRTGRQFAAPSPRKLDPKPSQFADDLDRRHGRRHGRLARLRSGRCIFRLRPKSPSSARTRVHSGLLRYDAERRSRLVARRARYAHAGKTQLRDHDARRRRPPEHPRAGFAEADKRPTRRTKVGCGKRRARTSATEQGRRGRQG